MVMCATNDIAKGGSTRIAYRLVENRRTTALADDQRAVILHAMGICPPPRNVRKRPSRESDISSGIAERPVGRTARLSRHSEPRLSDSQSFLHPMFKMGSAP